VAKVLGVFLFAIHSHFFMKFCVLDTHIDVKIVIQLLQFLQTLNEKAKKWSIFIHFSISILLPFEIPKNYTVILNTESPLM
jgi:hypothetical protein